MKPHLPVPRGPLTEMLIDRLLKPPGRLHDWAIPTDDPLAGEDTQLALHICYALHYDGFVGVDERWEWAPPLLELRSRVEDRFLTGLVATAAGRGAHPGIPVNNGEPASLVRRLLEAADGPSLSLFMSNRGTEDHLREFVIHRSIYQRKEADPHTWAIPRLRGRAKSALVELQADEYGNGIPGRSHAELFAATMGALDLDTAPGAYIDQVPGVTLATDNLVSLLGLHRRWRGALVGHLAAFEMTSVVPMSRYSAAVRRLLRDEAAAEFYDVHVQADLLHQQIATDDLIAGLVETDPIAAEDVAFGVAALLDVETSFADHLLQSWSVGFSSLGATRFSPQRSQRNPWSSTVVLDSRVGASVANGY
jgi:Iron-containing redox enzyme